MHERFIMVGIYTDAFENNSINLKSTTTSPRYSVSNLNEPTSEPDGVVEHEVADLFTAKKRKNRLSQMGKSSYGPQKLHRKK